MKIHMESELYSIGKIDRKLFLFALEKPRKKEPWDSNMSTVTFLKAMLWQSIHLSSAPKGEHFHHFLLVVRQN